jgi:hypothetical protein
MTLTWHSIHKGIEECNYQIDEDSAIEEQVAPQ